MSIKQVRASWVMVIIQGSIFEWVLIEFQKYDFSQVEESSKLKWSG